MHRNFEVVEICAGAGGQALGLETAGFQHSLAVELDDNACNTLRENRPKWKVREGDVVDPSVWNPSAYTNIPLLAGGVPCPPFSIAGKQLGSGDERDLFAWAVEQTCLIKPRALLLENVRGLSMARFAGYRQHVLDRLAEQGYLAEWRLLHASDYSVPQLRPRFILVALREEDAPYFYWPAPHAPAPTVGEVLEKPMGSQGWEGTNEWAARANKIAPTIVGGSKKHGGADLGPTRARNAWAALGVNAKGLADKPPEIGEVFAIGPKLTIEMTAIIQGWSSQYTWQFTGRKTAQYRQIGNAFPPPFAQAVGKSIMNAFLRTLPPRELQIASHDSLYMALQRSGQSATKSQLMKLSGISDDAELERKLSMISKDFDLEVDTSGPQPVYSLGKFRAFRGQVDHARHSAFLKQRARIS